MNLQYDIVSWLTTIVVTPDRQIVGQFHGTSAYPTRDTLNNLLLSLGAQMMDCSVGIPNEESVVSETTLNVYPNPAIQKATMLIHTPIEGDYKVVWRNNLGVTVHSFTTSLLQGQNSLSIDFTDFKAGVYYLSLSDASGNTIHKKIMIAD